MSLEKTFGERLKKAREDKGLSQKAVAEVIGKHYHRIIAYEKGTVDLEMVEKLAAAVGVSAWDLLKPSGAKSTPEPKKDNSHELLFQFLDAWRVLNEEERGLLVRDAENLVADNISAKQKKA